MCIAYLSQLLSWADPDLFVFCRGGGHFELTSKKKKSLDLPRLLHTLRIIEILNLMTSLIDLICD